MSLSTTFWIIMIVLISFIWSILTAAFNDDKTKGL